jgi:Big-like domain-containing protein
MAQSMVNLSARQLRVAVAISLTVILLTGISVASDKEIVGPQVSYPLQFSVSPPVRDMPSQARTPGPPREMPLHRPPRRASPGNVADPVLQTSTPTPTAAQSLSQWEGLGENYPGFAVTAVPPDPNMAVGPNHIVQWVNNGFVIFDKQGHEIQAPIDDGTFWGSSTCNQLGGFSDPIIQYDRIADRWLVGEVAIPVFPGLFGQFAQCFAVSTTSDPTGSYYMWAYGFGTNINDYPKIGMWPDAYYVTWNIFDSSGSNFAGPEACAWDRKAVISGASAPALVCFKLSNSYASLLPSDLDGAAAPPAGSPNFLMDVDTASLALHLWKFHVDFVNTKNSTFTGPTSLASVAPFTAPCPNTQDCIPQPGTPQKLDALGDRLMYRLAYRNFGDHESLVANHTVLTAGGNTGVRWYEVRSPNSAPTLYQQGTFAPDTDNRWMASIAMDQTGNIGVGFSVGSSAIYPSVRYTGWEVGNTLGSLQTESSMVEGGGSQTGYNRWGDYSAMRTDPSDDCTFWYTQEYQATTQDANWNTRIGSFRFSSCGQSRAATATTLGSSPNPSTFGESVTLTATVSPSAATGTVTFSDGSTSLGTASVGASGVATLSTSALSVGTHQLTATYNGDANYSTSTSSALTQTVNSGATATTTSVVSSDNPSVYGDSVKFTATINFSSATGSVTFKDGATSLGTISVVSGQASLSTSSLAGGSHSITAVYSGDGSFAGSTSLAFPQTVNKASTTTVLTSSPNPSKHGQTVTFTATITPSTATGTVSFFDGSTLLGTGTLSGGKATFATSRLSVGTHSITANYGGDGNYSTSPSAVLTETVTRK